MKMLMIVVPDSHPEREVQALLDDAEGIGLATHVVDLPGKFDLRAKLDDPTYGMALAGANLALLPIALNAFTDALAKDRELDR